MTPIFKAEFLSFVHLVGQLERIKLVCRSIPFEPFNVTKIGLNHLRALFDVTGANGINHFLCATLQVVETKLSPIYISNCDRHLRVGT